MTSAYRSDLELRLHRLERRQSLVLLLLAVLLGVTALSVGIACQPGEADSTVGPVDAGALRVRSLELVDADGRTRAQLRLTEAGPEFVLLDASERTRVSLVQQADQSGLFVQDAHGDVRVGTAHFGHGGSGLTLHGPGMKGGAVLYLKDGNPSLTFYDVEGEALLRLPSPQGADQ